MVNVQRTPQQQRSRETRKKILQSAVTCLAQYGWQASTVSTVAKHVGTSRGAVQHHFPTREDLMIAAIEFVFEQRVGLAFGPDTVVPEGRTRESFLIERLIHQSASELFKAALQVWIAAASEPALRERVVKLQSQFSRRTFNAAAEFLGADLDDEPTRRILQTLMDLARGLGLADLLTDDTERRSKIAQFWAAELELRTIRTTSGAVQGLRVRQPDTDQ